MPRGKAASLDQIVTFSQFIEKSGNLRKVVAIVRVSHDDEPATRGCDASH